MFIKKAAIAGMGAALISLSWACVAQDAAAARAVVEGPSNRVHEFHQNLMKSLKTRLGDNDPAKVAVVCDLPSVLPGEFNCDKLDKESTDRTEVIYTFFRDGKRLQAFVEAWDKLQTRQLSPSLTMRLDTKVPHADCGSFPTGPCVNAPFCPGPPKRCDKVQGPPCTACGT